MYNLVYLFRALSSCTTEQFLKIGTLLPELAVHEKTLDMLIDLLRKDQLDENLNLDNLEKSIAYFKVEFYERKK